MRRINTKIVYIAKVLVLAIVLSGCSTINGFKLWFPGLFGLESISDHFFVDSEMPEVQRDLFLKAASAAKDKVFSRYGEIVSSPDIFACSSKDCFQRIGSTTSKAKAYGSSKILLSPEGITKALIAHEWSHAELYDRIGGYPKIKRVPAWFNEGLAVVVSDEPSHSEEVWNYIVNNDIPRPQLAELTTRKDWVIAVRTYGNNNAGDPEKVSVVYATAGHEVRRWFNNVKTKGLINLIEMLNQGVPFEDVYQSPNSL